MPRKNMKMDMKMMNMQCCSEMHKGMGTKMLVLGLLIIANAYLNVVSWGVFVGAVIALAGLCKLALPKKKMM